MDIKINNLVKISELMEYPAVHILHLPHRMDRLVLLTHELNSQKITDYRIWEGIIDNQIPFRGINLAHKRIVQYAKDNNLPEILIAEDDLKFTCNRSFEYFLSNKPSDYDIYLSSVYNGIPDKENVVTDFAGLTLYFIHERFYDTFLSVPELDHIDRALAHKGKFVVCNPFIAIQHNTFSDNHKKVRHYDIEGFYRERTFLVS